MTTAPDVPLRRAARPECCRHRLLPGPTLVFDGFFTHADEGGTRVPGRSMHAPARTAYCGVGMRAIVPDKVNICLNVRLYGAPGVRLSGAVSAQITGARNIALIALLATAPDMRRSRAWLADTLWSDSTAARGRANLRQLLHALRQSTGPALDQLFDNSRDQIALRTGTVTFEGSDTDGEFLEGIDLPEEGFEDWLRAQRIGQNLPAPAVFSATQTHVLPRILVCPFAETAAAQPGGIGDALSQELTGHFARSQLIDAISHFTSRALAGPDDAPAKDAEYVLTGQCREANGHLTVDATLIETDGHRVLWSDRQKIRLRDFLAGEDYLTSQIVGQALRIIMSRSIAAGSCTPLPELEAHSLLISAVALMHSFEKRHFHRAEAQLGEVIRRCPGHSVPRAWLAQWHLLRIYQKWSDDIPTDETKAQAAVRNALDLNAGCALSLAIDGNIQTILRRDFAAAQQRFDAAQDINPSSAFISQLNAVLDTFTGDGARAVALTDRAFMLSPRDPRRPFFQTLSAGSYVAGGRFDEAVEMAEASLRHNPLHLSAHRCRVIGLQLAGREAEARKAAGELMRLDPGLRVSEYQRNHPAAQSSISHIWADALRHAGVPVN
ncbi:hypothetical protein [uncultured Roseobacter sp.]|uniref:hypothetical protein n=1 Tax=uncultured Roseobacter sp. TaxID=114847 RepID=UPI0026317EAB|nr:hypothetical protein [uncultured Roseobacter sp.]